MSLPISDPILASSSEAPPPEESVYLETMFRALEEPNGMVVETDTKAHAIALRHRFYRARRDSMVDGNNALDQLTIAIKFNHPKWELHLTRLPFTVRPR